MESKYKTRVRKPLEGERNRAEREATDDTGFC